MAVTTKTTLVTPSPSGPVDDGLGLQLLVIDGVSVAVHPYPKLGSLVVGRSTRADITIDEPHFSRRHLELTAEPLAVTDLGSANGTFVRGMRLPAGGTLPLAPGDAITVGGATLLVQESAQRLEGVGLRRLCRHSYFEERVQDECLRARATGLGFQVARLALPRDVSWTMAAPILATSFPSPHVLASYGPHDYEVLLVGLAPQAASQRLSAVQTRFSQIGLACRWGMSSYPSDGKDVESMIAHACGALRVAPLSEPEPPVQPSEAMRVVLSTSVRVAPTSIHVMILGETGVGKEVLARRIHELSGRRSGPFCGVNCGALNPSILEAELFGSEKGAFTGAVSKKGLLESSSGGTFFLDELAEMPIPVQIKLLRALQENEVVRVGGTQPRKLDLRVISATNQDIEAAVHAGRFRSDLFYRLNGVLLTVPPLRQRVSEIRQLAERFAANFVGGEPYPYLDPETSGVLERYAWPGNIRELRNVIERACALADGARLLPEHLPERLLLESTRRAADAASQLARQSSAGPGELPDKNQELRQRVLTALQENAGNQTRAARDLGIPRRTFVAMLARLNVPRPRKSNNTP